MTLDEAATYARAMTSAGQILALARRAVTAVAALSLGACCREVGRFDQAVSLTDPRVPDGGPVDASCSQFCARAFFRECARTEVSACAAETVDGGAGVRCTGVHLECAQFGAVCGRRTADLSVERDADKLGALVALEAEAIAAFERLAKELACFGAPPSLVDAARTCAEDERAHVFMLSALAGRAPMAEPEHEQLAVRSLFEVALENAVEGCVRETFGVVIAAWQAEHAESPAARGCYAQIAEDEARHAALAHEVEAWFDARLTEGERAVVALAKRTAVVSLKSEQRGARDDSPLGLPGPVVACALVDASFAPTA